MCDRKTGKTEIFVDAIHVIKCRNFKEVKIIIEYALHVTSLNTASYCHTYIFII